MDSCKPGWNIDICEGICINDGDPPERLTNSDRSLEQVINAIKV